MAIAACAPSTKSAGWYGRWSVNCRTPTLWWRRARKIRARLDLSFIERAYFAASIEDRGFDRSVIMAALSVEKTQLSRLISIGRGVPYQVIGLIGPAPKTGRPRWEALVDARRRPRYYNRS